ncbi:chemotaxis protein CheW [Nodosilinea nodulosa]|uniref:chemotaxis protein CheW n=1 Tax=Nodosilinea nodulosa TaxID=416001 RepID=UPI0002E432BF|nr:chemotaxis protein CheW [Nodosilinea nodulosa]
MDFEAAIAADDSATENAAAPPLPAPPGAEGEPPAASEEQFLQITVNGNLLLLPGSNLVEIMRLAPSHVVPMFEMAPWVMGIYNWRGSLLWIADLGHFLGFVPWYQQAKAATEHTVVVIQPPTSAPLTIGEPPPTLGLVVSAVEAMVTYPAPASEPLPAHIAPSLLPFLQGCCASGQHPLPLILDGSAILSAMAQPWP